MRVFGVVVLSLLLAPVTHAQERLFANENTVEAWLQENHVPALGVGVIRDGQLQQVSIFGELRKGVPAPHDAIFNVASLTKPIVSMLTLRLVSAGKWDLDEPLTHYWTDPDIAADPRRDRLTTRHVLSHQTGFPNWRFMHASKKLVFEFDPGARVQYSGEGFEYLRKALEKKFDKSLAQLSREILLTPLRMTDTQHAWNEHVDESRFARWHDEKGEHAYRDDHITEVNAADNLLTTVEDYGRFAASVIRFEGVSPAVVEQMLAPRAKIKENHFMALGWEMLTGLPNDEYVLIHSGSDEGVRALVMLLPKSGQGLIVMTNGDNGQRLYPKLIMELLDRGGEIMSRAQ